MGADRETWGRKVEFLLATCGYAVGLGNVWRFPYLCFRSGGGAFLIPLFLMLILCGIPLLYMEMAVGQLTKQGPIGAIGKLCPLFKGAGIATVVISFLFTTYYNVIITWSFYYLFSTFRAILPWTDCSHDWNSQHCWVGTSDNKTVLDPLTNVTTVIARGNDSLSPTEDFYERRLLEKTSGIDETGALQWDLTLILLLCWVLVYFCIWKGPKSTGKVVYFTATFPYLVLVILLVRGLTLPGAVNGILYFIVPQWELLLDAKFGPLLWTSSELLMVLTNARLSSGSSVNLHEIDKNGIVDPREVSPLVLIPFLSISWRLMALPKLSRAFVKTISSSEDVHRSGPNCQAVAGSAVVLMMFYVTQVWVNAAAQNFNSLGIAFGGIITMSSYNKSHNRIIKDVLIIAVVDAFTCLLAGFAIFSILGYLAHNQGVDVENVIKDGPGLVFVIYPEAFTMMPVSQLFAALFFFMLICLGIDSQFASVEVIVTTLQDHFAPQVKKYLKRKEILVAVVCLVSFLCGLPNVTQGGIYFFQLIDYYAAALSLMYLAFFEVIAITWFYGARRLARNVEDATGERVHITIIICWYFLSPLFIFGIWIFSMVQYQPFQVADYTYPTWATALGWLIAMMSIVCIPAGMVHAIWTAKGDTLWQRFKSTLKSPLPNPLDAKAAILLTKIPADDQNDTEWKPFEPGYRENGTKATEKDEGETLLDNHYSNGHSTPYK